jgi:hypothetical protein
MTRMLILLVVLLPQLLLGQDKNPCYQLQFDSTSGEVFKRMHTPAQLQGGEIAWTRFVERNTDLGRIVEKMPDSIPDLTDSTTVRFILSKQGIISNIEIVHDSPYGMGAEITRVIIASCEKKWIPGIDASGAYRNTWVAYKFYFIIQADMSNVQIVRTDPFQENNSVIK